MAFTVEMMTELPGGRFDFNFVPRPEGASNEEYLEMARQNAREMLGQQGMLGATVDLICLETSNDYTTVRPQPGRILNTIRI